ncbi:MAG: DNA/RNA helicase domain-containing protein, partial [Polyangiales bacterium]
PRLLDHLVETVKGNHEWNLLDVQRTVYWSIRHAVQVARDANERRVVVVRGGPGTGKSVLAIQLLADAARQHWVVAHATGSKAFQTVLQGRTLAFSASMLKRIHNAKLKKHLPVDQLFTTFAQVAKVGADTPGKFDLVVCDESHRLWEHRRMKYPNGTVKWLTETSMIEELIRASRVTAFFLDDNQSVRSGEIGRSDRILETAERLGIEVLTFDLDAQFRCAGSESYIHWVEHLCGHRAVTDLEWRVEDTYAVQVWDSMPALDAHLKGKLDEGARVRLIAGYCWRWRKPDANGTLPRDLTDVRFDGWSGAWIAKTGQFRAPLENQYYRWATDPTAYDEVGSIYSAQGFEFEDVGILWGEDLVWRGGRWVAQLDRNKDGTFKKELRKDGGDAVEKLLNVYRVLLTRGMHSTHLFILDDETRAHVRACLEVPVVQQRAVNDDRSRLEVRSMGTTARTLRVVSNEPREGLRLIEPRADECWRTCVPLIPLRAAAGGFSAEHLDLSDPTSALSWVTWDDARGIERGMFAATVVGSSMSPDVSAGSLCLFRRAAGIATSTRAQLVRHAGSTDSDTGGQFTVKDVYVLEDAARPGRVGRVELRSRNPSFAPIVFTSDAEIASIRVVAELVRVLGRL